LLHDTNLSSKKNSAQEFITDSIDTILPTEITYIKILNIDVPIRCPKCQDEMKIRDTKRRYIRFGNGERYPFNLRRYYCSICHQLHTEIPDLVQPYKHYDSQTIEKVKSGDSSDFGGDDSTIRKWRGEK